MQRVDGLARSGADSALLLRVLNAYEEDRVVESLDYIVCHAAVAQSVEPTPPMGGENDQIVPLRGLLYDLLGGAHIHDGSVIQPPLG
jgi:hypothetical protein